mmetsp:Transcript_70849/g.125112  ORF Transcript_70849/g.125112 Transcript_70849/m.125112 type:complete len:622 (-) Transcript_70849:101-1966(-)
MISNVRSALKKLRGLPDEDEVSTDVETVSNTGDDSDSDSDSSSDESLTPFDRKLEEQMFAKEAQNGSASKGPDPDLWVDSKPYCVVSAALSLFNLLFAGLETDMTCRTNNCTKGPQWEMVGVVITLVFVIETAVRVWEAGPYRFIFGERTKEVYKLDWMNCIDVVLVLFRCFDYWLLAPVGVQSGLRYLSLFRIIRIGPAVRHWQHSPMFKELWLAVSSVSETLKTLFWIIFMILCVTMTFAVLVTMQLMDSTAEEFNFSRAEWGFADYWGSVPASALSLFQVTTKDKWSSSLVSPTMEVLPWSGVIFAPFFLIVGLALMNTIIGAVVECTISSSKKQQDMEQKAQERAEAAITESLRQIFHAADADGSGEIDMDELLSLVGQFKVRERLRLLRIPFLDLTALLTILDFDEKGSVNVNMFFRGVAKLRGQARASDLHQLHIDLNTCMEWVQKAMQGVNYFNGLLGISYDALNDMDAKVFIDDTSDDKDPVLSVRKVRTRMTAEELRKPRRQSMMGVFVTPDMMWHGIIEQERKPSKGSIVSKDKQDLFNSLSDHARTSILKKRESRIEKTAEKIRKAKEASQPPPPPLPDHIKQLMDYKAKAKAEDKAATKKNKAVKKKVK